jgi:heterodisulfide reductase subunit B
MTQISEATGFELIRRLVKGAADYQADVIVTVCPMCQLNLDAFQGAMNRYFKSAYHVPVLYYTQMIGLAFGLDPETLGIGSELVDARPALAKIGVELPPSPVAEGPARRKRDDKSLPMPKMPQHEAPAAPAAPASGSTEVGR